LRWLWPLLALIVLAISLSSIRTAIAQSTNEFEATLDELGYDERQLVGPISSATYYFSWPANWEPQDGSYVQLDLDYVVGEEDGYPTALLEVRLNGELLHTEDLESQGSQILSVDIPPDKLISAEAESLNSLRLDFVVDEESERAMSASLIVKVSSLLYLVYQQGYWQPDLALYPMPIYQEQSFQPRDVRFILPSEPSSADLRAAAMIAARLGRLTLARLPISATLASDLSPDTLPDTHLIFVGRPDDNPLIRELDLPISLAERRLAIHSQMPALVKPGDTISYTLVVENTSDVTQSVAVEDRLPAEVEWLACSGECEEIEPGAVRWEIGSLVPGDSVSAVFSMRVDELVPPGATMEHTASLVDSNGEVLNVDTLSTHVGTVTSGELVVSRDEVSDYFWVHLDRGVAERDGLVQEIVSPSNSGRAAIVVTGLDNEGVLKAARALSSDTDFLGMSGDYAIVQAAQAIPETAAESLEGITVASLGYHESIYNLHSEYFDYYFDLPPGWDLNADAILALHIAHSVALNDIATLDVKLNSVSIGNISLDESNAHDSWIAVPLPSAASRAGSNRILLQVSADIEDVRSYILSDRYWLTVYADTFFHLPRQKAGLTLGLESFPDPFNSHPTLEDVVFILPEAPTLMEIEGVLRLAHRLGIVTGGDAFWPQVAIGGKPDTEPWTDHHIIAVGRPTRNPYIAAVSDALPQPFRPGTDEIAQEIDQVVFRMPSGVSLGYVQELISPWNEDRAMMAVTGTTDEGVDWALASLTDSELIRRLAGNLAVVRDQEVRSMDTREVAPEVVAAVMERIGPGLATSAVSTPTPTVTPPPSLSTTPTVVPETALPTPIPVEVSGVTSSAEGFGRPDWVIPVLIVSALVVVGSIGVAFWQARSG
jgi:uncharacterized repeat protein (TIGR01451 family)